METVTAASILFILIGIVIGLAGGLMYLFFVPIKRYLLKSGRLTSAVVKKINTIYIFVLFFLTGFLTYTAKFPMDSFYKDEFKLNTGIDMPLSASIVRKDSWYPDTHGKYWAAAIVKLNKKDYKMLSKKINELQTFQVDTTSQQIGITTDYKTLTRGIKNEDIQRVVFNTKKRWFKLAFLKDKQTIIFERN